MFSVCCRFLCDIAPPVETVIAKNSPTKVVKKIKLNKLHFSNAGRSVLPLRLIDDSELTNFKSKKEIDAHLEATRLCDVMFCTPSDVMKKVKAMDGNDILVYEPFLVVRIIIEQLWSQFPRLCKSLQVGVLPHISIVPLAAYIRFIL